MFLFGKKTKKYLGIDIGTAAIKIAELEKAKERYILKNYAIVYFENYLTGESRQEKDIEKCSAIIKKALAEAGISSKEAYFSVPIYNSFSVYLTFPAEMSRKEIASSIQYEAKKYVPVSISEVALDWSIIPNADQQKDAKQQNVFLVAVPKKNIRERNQIADLAGVKNGSVEGEAFALKRSLVGNDRTPTLIIDIGGHSTDLVVVDAGYIRATHNLARGGGNISKDIAHKLDLPEEEAEKQKIIKTESNKELQEILYANLERIAEEIRRVVGSYETKHSRKIEQGIVTGGASLSVDLKNYLSKKLSLEIISGNSFARVAFPPELNPILGELNSSLAVAIGLAMQE